ncbi:putative sugar nucleotidyl transferase [Sphingobacterium daejeonense]|uniref:putative sugar nucleotidyl transferase n=1 Tax=Sphingobacterium daejeonense TaxID=371142 RepID=UPI001485561E|nr:putative sugar nucleotidyl transferase [Sphingobacterium daejeonense]
MSLTIVLFDNAHWRRRLFPFAATRPIGNIRTGICTLDGKWGRIFEAPVTFDTVDYLSDKFPFSDFGNQDFLIIRSNVLPSDDLIVELKSLNPGEVLLDDNSWVAIRSTEGKIDYQNLHLRYNPIKTSCNIQYLNFLEDIFLQNKSQLLFDYNLLTAGRNTASISSSNAVYGSWIFVEEGAQVEGVSLNSLEGPIYIGKGCKIEEGQLFKRLCCNRRWCKGQDWCSIVSQHKHWSGQYCLWRGK